MGAGCGQWKKHKSLGAPNYISYYLKQLSRKHDVNVFLGKLEFQAKNIECFSMYQKLFQFSTFLFIFINIY